MMTSYLRPRLYPVFSRVLVSKRSYSAGERKCKMPQAAKVVSMEDMPISEAKWITLKKIKYVDQEGKEVRCSCLYSYSCY